MKQLEAKVFFYIQDQKDQKFNIKLLIPLVKECFALLVFCGVLDQQEMDNRKIYAENYTE